MASCLLEREALAQDPELDYHAPAGCPSAAEFKARVARTLQRPPDDFEGLGRFQVTIAPAPQGFELTVRSEVGGERGTRVLSSPDCSSVADAGALSIAMALSSFADAEGDAPSPAESAKGVAPSAPASGANGVISKPAAPNAAPPPDTVARPESAPPARNSLSFQLFGDYGALPRVTPGFRLSVGRAGQRWSGRLGLAALLPATRWVDGEEGTVGGRFWLGVGRAEGCARAAGRTQVSLDACVVFEAGVLPGAGVGVDVSQQATLPWLAPGARVVGALPLTTSRAHAVLGVEGLVPLLRKSFTIERGRTALHRPASLVGRMDLGVAWQF